MYIYTPTNIFCYVGVTKEALSFLILISLT